MTPFFTRTLKAAGKKLFLPAALLILLSASGCSNFSVPGPTAPPTDRDVSEMAPGSLKVAVLDYTWNYLPGNNHVQIQGTVVNGEDGPLQGVILGLVLHDQNGTPVAYGETYVNPTYLVPSAKGTFSVMALINRQKGVTHTRLVTNAQVRSYY